MNELERLNNVLKMVFLKIGIYRKAEMAEFLGYKSPYFSGIINGKEKLTDQFLKNISDKLGVNATYILEGKGEIFKTTVNQHNVDGDNINGTNVTINKSQTDKFLDLLKNKDEQIGKIQQQMDRLIDLISKTTNNHEM